MKSFFDMISCCFNVNKDTTCNSEVAVDKLKSFEEQHEEKIKILQEAKNTPKMKYILSKEVSIPSSKYHLPKTSDPFEHMDMKAYNYFSQKNKLNYSFEYIYKEISNTENELDSTSNNFLKNTRDIKIVVVDTNKKESNKKTKINDEKLLNLNYKAKSFNASSTKSLKSLKNIKKK